MTARMTTLDFKTVVAARPHDGTATSIPSRKTYHAQSCREKESHPIPSDSHFLRARGQILKYGPRNPESQASLHNEAVLVFSHERPAFSLRPKRSSRLTHMGSRRVPGRRPPRRLADPSEGDPPGFDPSPSRGRDGGGRPPEGSGSVPRRVRLRRVLPP